MGNVNQTVSVLIMIDIDGPRVIIVSPSPGTYGPASMLINASITDDLSTVSSAFAMINATPQLNLTLTKGVVSLS